MILKSAQLDSSLDVAGIRRDFPILSTRIDGKDLVYLDNAASTQKPLAVIERLERYYRSEHANIHRGVHYLSQMATSAYEASRERVREFINAREAAECIFTRGTTEAINLVASSWGRANLERGDEVVVTQMEHHANIVPWQLLEEEIGIVLRVVLIDETGSIVMDAFKKCFSERTKLLSFCHVSNSLGTINPAKEMVQFAKARGVPVLIDGAQAAPHMPIDVQDLGCDFYAFSGHKVFGPTGIGVLYGRREVLSKMPPYQAGGDMIERVSFSGTTFRGIPERFEAGTPHIAGVVGLAAALDYVSGLGRQELFEYEQQLCEYATAQVQKIDGLRIYGEAAEKASVISFNIDGIHPNDVGTVLDSMGIAVRTGHHCTMPLWEHYGVTGTVRASFAFYNTISEVDALVSGLQAAIKLLK